MYETDKLKQALKDGSLTRTESETVLLGFIKDAPTEDTILFCDTGDSEWIELPLSMIQSAELLTTKSCCGNVRMPIMKVILNEPENNEAKILYSLLKSRTSGSRTFGAKTLRALAKLRTTTPGPTAPPTLPPQKCGDCELIWIVCMDIATTPEDIQTCMDDALNCLDTCF